MFWGLCLQFIVWTYVTARATVLIDSDGGYKNVVVAIDPKIPESKIASHLKELEILFNNASRVLNTATRGQTFFKEVVFAVPKKYRTTLSEMEWTSDGSPFSSPDVILTSDDPFSGPYALQNDGCGKPGLRIHVQEEFLSAKGNNERARALVKEWAKYRYGVFDESGFSGDPLYPACFTVPGSNATRATDCADKEVVYYLRPTTRQSPESCDPVPVYGKNQHVTSSLMSRTDLPGVSHFCDDGAHNRNLPTQQNLLCGERSTWKVILQHSDFKFRPTKKVSNVRDSVTFKYVIEPDVRLIVAVDTSNSMVQEDRLDMVKNAFSYFVLYNLPEFSVVGLKNLKNRESPLLVTVRAPADAEKLIDSFPEPYGEEEVCIHCGIEQALQTLKTSPEEISQGDIVVISATDIDQSHVASLENVLQKTRAALHVLYFRKRLKAAPLLQKLALVSGGSFFYIPEDISSDAGTSTLTLIYEGFRSIYESFSWTNKNHVLVEQKTFTKDSCTTCSLTFPSDPSMDSFQVLLTGPKFLFGPPVIRDKTVLSNGNQNFSAGHSSYSYKIKIPAYVFTIKNPKSNEWSLTFERRPGSVQPVVVIVRASSPKRDGIIHMKTWMDTEESSKGIPSTRPAMRFYSEVKRGHLPVANATVTAILYHPETGEEVKLDLMDRGDGDPDITGNDGIFSRYFSEVDRSGYYILTTVVESYASISQSEEPPAASKSFRCCGSSYPAELAFSAAGPFKRLATYGSFYVAAENAGTRFPPRRISDLRAARVQLQQLKDRMAYRLEWTAPGDNFDYGRATNYQLRMFSSRDDASHRFESDYVLTIDNFHIHGRILEPLPAGTSHSVIIEPINATSGTYYLAIRAENLEGKYSEISNVVEIKYEAPFMPLIKTTNEPVTGITSDPNDFHEGREPLSDNFRLAIGLSVGFLFLCIVIGIVLFLYCAKKRKNRKEEEAKRQKILSQFGGGPSLDEVHKAESRDALCQSNNALNVSVISPVNSWTAGSLISHYETLQKHKNSDTSESSTIHPKDMSDTNSTGSSKYSYVNKVDQNASYYDPIYFPPQQHERDDANYPYNPSYGPFNPPYTSSLRRSPENQPYASFHRQTPSEYSQIYASPRRQTPEVSSVGHGYSSNSINFYKPDRSPVRQLGTDL